MNYTLHQLQVFIKVVQTKSITKASEELYMTQPAVSIQLKKFQDQFDIPLTEIIKKRLRVTDFGMEIYEMSERILNEVYAINYKTEAYKGLLAGKISISVVSTGKYIMPYLLSDFIKKNPGIDLIMDVTNKSKVIERLSNGEIDFALVSMVPEKFDVNEEILMENDLYFVANKNLKLTQSKLNKEDLEKHVLIYREEGSATRTVMETYFEQRNLKARKRIELTSNEAVKQALIAGLGISIMPIIGINEEIKNKKLKILPASGLPIRTMWRLIWLKEKSMTPVAREYLGYIRSNKHDLIKTYFNVIK